MSSKNRPTISSVQQHEAANKSRAAGETGGDESMDSGVSLTVSELETLENFHVLEELGEGSFSTVFAATSKKTGRKYALKVKQVFRERDALRALSSPTQRYVPELYATFHDATSLYFVLSYARYRDIGLKMHKTTFPPETTRFVSAEVVQALDYIHSHGILHRDIKPQNILVREDFHIMLSDFGCCVTFDALEEAKQSECKRKCSFVGSNLYVSPEVLNGHVIDETCDYFALGSIIFEMLAGRAPFYDVSEYLVFQRITRNRYTFADDFTADAPTRSIIKAFLAPKAAERLGAPAKGGAAAIRDHAFYHGLDWTSLSGGLSPLAHYYTIKGATDANGERVEGESSS